ncbi:DUF305 domain-containing protein [Chelatococcus sp. GCM10030263]|uniref:CopM family metallochaperone n=1 Tax=Chelatococcus sp. GCM10030263 TaxID=3273387 RepID=UPI00360E60C8
MKYVVLAVLASLVAIAPFGEQALSQQQTPHSNHSMPMGSAQTSSASTEGYKAANEAMHRAMNIPFTGDADVDFVRQMMPHHRAAVDMAKVVLAHGKDPEIKKLAQEIIAAQEKEIAFMQSWLAKHGK